MPGRRYSVAYLAGLAAGEAAASQARYPDLDSVMVDGDMDQPSPSYGKHSFAQGYVDGYARATGTEYAS